MQSAIRNSKAGINNCTTMGVYAVTGSLASGKSTVAAILEKKGARVFDCDRIIHDCYRDPASALFKKIAFSFPGVGRHRSIDRKKLGAIAFGDARARKKLERIVHPFIIKELRAWTHKVINKKGIYIAEVPLLFEKNLQGLFDKIILVYARRNILVGRAVHKYRCSRWQAMRRLSLFIPMREKLRRSDFIIDNNGDIRALRRQAALLWPELNKV
jgi:dephospho-CoA kinase